jgi:division/cell wall cluster transcriptional repressor MraZ
MVPSKWRPKSGKTELSVLPWPLGDQQFLLVLPPARWNLLLERLNEMSLSDDEAAVVERVIGGNSARLILDKAGRLCLPEELAAVAGLRKEAMFVGRLNKFEIWEPGRFNENNKGNEAVAAAAIKNLNL